eukprot:2052087-Rhodomonas_salina.1
MKWTPTDMRLRVSSTSPRSCSFFFRSQLAVDFSEPPERADPSERAEAADPERADLPPTDDASSSCREAPSSARPSSDRRPCVELRCVALCSARADG